MRNTWLVADTHFGHRNILALEPGRPGATIEEHDELLIERWNAVVRPDDQVWHLGDVSLSVPVMERVTPRLNGHKYLVAGNHDLCWAAHPSQKRRERVIQMIGRYRAAGFERVYDSGVVYGERIAGTHVVLSHLPADGDHSAEQRYVEQRPQPLNTPVVCGHVHSAWRTYGPQVNVGVDVWDYMPVHADEIADEIASDAA